MARGKTSPLSVKKQRLDLPVSKKPVFESLGDGVSIGYRRNQSAGTWIARKADGKGGSWQKVIGTADDYADADNITVLSWAQAQAKVFEASKTLGRLSSQSARPPTTVETAFDAYESDLKTRGGDLGNVQRLRFHVGDELRAKAVGNLVTADLREWRDGLTNSLAPATVNRTSNAFKAALNLAADQDERISTRNAWEKGLKAIPDAEEARNVILSDTQIKKLVGAAYGVSQEFGLLVEVAAATGSRYSQIANLTVGDLQDDRDGPRLMMPSAKKGKGQKHVLRRPFPILAVLAGKLRTAAGDRSDDAPLLLKPQRPQTEAERKSGIPASPPDRWRKSDHARLFTRAVEAAFKPEEKAKPVDRAAEGKEDEGAPVTIYALRHSSIVRQILANVPVRLVATLHDTSVQMIERNYSKFLADHSDAIARATMFDLSAPE